MHTDKELLAKAIKSFGFTALLMFAAPVVLYQAFKNQNHPWYYPVLIVGLALAIAAIAKGFHSVKLMMDALFGKKK
ncbi:MAG: DUF6095 family protein [Flavobacteriaceae bacterium]|nr:DUF6095 family protein [Flavobacteriaceae bacterium]